MKKYGTKIKKDLPSIFSELTIKNGSYPEGSHYYMRTVYIFHSFILSHNPLFGVCIIQGHTLWVSHSAWQNLISLMGIKNVNLKCYLDLILTLTLYFTATETSYLWWVWSLTIRSPGWVHIQPYKSFQAGENAKKYSGDQVFSAPFYFHGYQGNV